MRFRYFDSDGTEVELSSVDALEFRIGTGAVTPETLLYDSAVGTWAPARRHAVFRFLVERDEDLLPEDSRAMWEEAGDEPVIGAVEGAGRPPAPDGSGVADDPAGTGGREVDEAASAESSRPEASGTGDASPAAEKASPSPERPPPSPDDAAPSRGAASSSPGGAPPPESSPPNPSGDPAAASDSGGESEGSRSAEDDPSSGAGDPEASPGDGTGGEGGGPVPWWGRGSSVEEPTAPEPPEAEEGAPPAGRSREGDPTPVADGEDALPADASPTAPDPGLSQAPGTGWLEELAASTGSSSSGSGTAAGERHRTGSGEPGEPALSGTGSDGSRRTRLRVLILLLVLFAEVLIAGDLVGPGFDALAANGSEMRDLTEASVEALREVATGTREAAPSLPASAADGEQERGEASRALASTRAGPESAHRTGPPAGAASAGDPAREADDLESLAAEVTGAAFSDLADSMVELQESLGVEERPPEVWLDGAYLANAHRYPEVGEYWRRYGSWVAAVRALEEELFRGFVQNRVLKMGLDTADAAGLSARILERYGRSSERRGLLYGDLAALADEALALHGTLVERTDAISHEPFAGEGLSRDPVIEAVAEDPELAEEIWSRLDRIFVLLERIQGIRPVSTFRLQEALLEGLEVPERGS